MGDEVLGGRFDGAAEIEGKKTSSGRELRLGFAGLQSRENRGIQKI